MKKIDENIISLARSGDEVAMIQLLEVCQPDLKRFSRKVCSNAEDAEDAVQVALWALYKKIGVLHTISAISVWLFRIVERECYRIFHVNKKSITMDPSDMDILLEGGRNYTDEQALKIDLSKIITSLPLSYRTVLILRDVKELTAPEVASMLGITIEAVKSRLHRARSLVRKELGNNNYLS